MDITSLGHASFRLRGKKATVVTDPFNPDMVGLKFPKHTSADIVTISHDHPDHNFSHIVEDPEGSKKIIFNGPGEYEAKGVEILGVGSFHDTKQGSERGKNTIYKIDIDQISVVHLGDLGHKVTEEIENELDVVDILLIPVGGLYTIDAHTAAQVVTDLEPKMVIPMHYKRDGMDEKVFGQLSRLTLFLKEMGVEGITPQPKLSITKEKLPEEMQVVVLE